MLKQDLYDGMIATMKRKDKTQTAIFRMINAEIKNEEISQKCKDLSDEDVIKILKKLQKQMKESFEAFKAVGNQDRYNEIRIYLMVISAYLPKELDENVVKMIIFEVFKENEIKNSGEAMRLVMQRVKGQVNGKVVKELVDEYMKDNIKEEN